VSLSDRSSNGRLDDRAERSTLLIKGRKPLESY
jgi:hypothetical protein